MAGEHRTPEYRSKVNPYAQVPTLSVDDSLFINDSHAILTFLADSYEVDDHWYPKEARKRAMVDFWMHWHHLNIRRGARIFFEKFVKPMIGFKTNKHIMKDCANTYENALNHIESVLTKNAYLCGDHPTIADLSIVVDVYHCILGGYTYDQWPAVKNWMSRMLSIPGIADAHIEFEKLKENMEATPKL